MDDLATSFETWLKSNERGGYVPVFRELSGGPVLEGMDLEDLCAIFSTLRPCSDPSSVQMDDVCLMFGDMGV